MTDEDNGHDIDEKDIGNNDEDYEDDNEDYKYDNDSYLVIEMLERPGREWLT